MSLLTFKGGIHPYEGKELRRSRSIFRREIWSIHSASISVHRQSLSLRRAIRC